jgi:hypothetical protein
VFIIILIFLSLNPIPELKLIHTSLFLYYGTLHLSIISQQSLYFHVTVLRLFISTWRTPYSTSNKTDLMAMNTQSFGLSRKISLLYFWKKVLLDKVFLVDRFVPQQFKYIILFPSDMQGFCREISGRLMEVFFYMFFFLLLSKFSFCLWNFQFGYFVAWCGLIWVILIWVCWAFWICVSIFVPRFGKLSTIGKKKIMALCLSLLLLLPQCLCWFTWWCFINPSGLLSLFCFPFIPWLGNLRWLVLSLFILSYAWLGLL